MRRFAIRIDDIAPDMDWNAFCRFAALLDTYDVKPLIGVIPENKDPRIAAPFNRRNAVFIQTEGSKGETEDPKGKIPEMVNTSSCSSGFGKWLKEKQQEGWTVAMHGYDHIYRTKKGGLFPLNHASEFAGRSYEEQLKSLQRGRKKMAELGAQTDIFMAPSHSFDKNTLRALKKCGFRYITDGFGGEAYTREGLTFLPISFLKSREMKKKEGITTFVVHTWDMDEAEYSFYRRLFEKERQRVVDYKELLNLPAGQRSIAVNAKEYILAFGKRLMADGIRRLKGGSKKDG